MDTTVGGILMKATKMISMLAVLAFASVATAADEGFKISGDVATSYFSESGSGNNSVGTGASGAVSSNDSFSVDMVEVNLEKSLGNSGMVLGIGYGRIFENVSSILDPANVQVGTVSTGAGAGGTVLGHAPKNTLNLTNAYFHHKLGDTGLTFKLGRFGTGIGLESYRYMDDMNYTRSYGFGMKPYFMTGLNVMYSHDMFDVGVTVANSTANTDTDDNANKTVQVSASVKPMEGLAVNLHYLVSKTDAGAAEKDLTLGNLNVTYKYQMMDFALDYIMTNTEPVVASPGKDKESSIAAYAGYTMDNMGAGLRYEMYKVDPNAGTSSTINAYTLTGYWDADQNARVKLEVGMQKGEATSFKDKDNAAKDSMNFYGAAVMYRF
jgi:hypothetical protein